MPLRASATRRASWTRQELYIYERTFLELHPETGTGYWLVVDVRDGIRVGGPCQRLNLAKVTAERLVERDPRYRKE